MTVQLIHKKMGNKFISLMRKSPENLQKLIKQLALFSFNNQIIWKEAFIAKLYLYHTRVDSQHLLNTTFQSFVNSLLEKVQLTT